MYSRTGCVVEFEVYSYGLSAVSGLNIDIVKSKLVRLGKTEEQVSLATVLGCRESNLSIKYLSIPLGANYKNTRTWEPVVDRFDSQLAGWKEGLLSKGGQLTLIKSTLYKLPIHYLFLISIPVSVAKKLEAIQCRFLWGNVNDRRKFHLVAWKELKKPLAMGGLGILSQS